MKAFRKRFVLINMSFVTFVLLVVFVALAAVTHYNNYQELQSTMSHVLQPMMEPGKNSTAPAPPKGLTDDEPNGENGPAGPQQVPKKNALFHAERSQIITVFYDSTTDESAIISKENSEVEDSTVYEVIPAVVDAQTSFGKIPSHKLLYYKETIGSKTKIALTQLDYITSRTAQSCLVFFLIFLVSSALFLVISIRLSKIAVRPMENAMRRERQFVTDLSHDLKTPITVILANNSILKDNADTKISEQMQWVESTDTASKNMLHLINEMLTLSALDDKDVSSEKEKALQPVSLSSAAEKAALQLESLAYDRGIRMEEDIEDGIRVLASAEYLDRICSGLLENALKYEKDDGKVSMTLKANKKKALLTVHNQSSHIPPEEQAHIFERFYRGDKARDIQKGHGLGLPIIKQVTEQIGAKISVSSTPEDGTAFLVEFDRCGD